jgi:hypothetical protein
MLAAIPLLGTVPGWLTFAAVIVLAYLLRGGQLGPAISYLRETNRTLSEQNRQLTEQLAGVVAENAKLHATRDLAPLLELVADHEARAATRDAGHEQRASERNEAILTVLALIADRLGPDNGGDSAAAAQP